MPQSKGKYEGDCLATVYDIVNTTLAQHGLEIYPIETLCEILADAPAAIFECSTCQSRKGLTYCKHCKGWFCMKPCLTDHACAQIDGPSTDPLRG